MLLNGKVAIVTGGAQGIGRACVERLASEGAKVIAADTQDTQGNRLADALSKKGQSVRFVHANVTERLDMRNLVAAAVEAYGRLDVLVTCAGMFEVTPFLDLDEETFDKVMDVNLKGTFLAAQCAAKQMVRQLEAGEGPPGAIVTVTSVNAWFGLPGSAAYATSKGGVMQLTKSMAMALADHGIRVNAVGPGTIETKMSEAVTSDLEMRDRVLARTPLGRLGKPEEIAAVAAWLASDQASYITGQTVYADGGRMSLNLTREPPADL